MLGFLPGPWGHLEKKKTGRKYSISSSDFFQEPRAPPRRARITLKGCPAPREGGEEEQ